MPARYKSATPKDSSAVCGFEDAATRRSAPFKSEATLRTLGAAKDNVSARPVLLFYSTLIPVCIWFPGKSKNASAKSGLRRRPIFEANCIPAA